MGAESTFTYQNFNIERGIVWNQENAINRGIQVNQTMGKYLTASFSWNDGYYSNRYSWLSGSVTLTKGPHVLVYDGNGEPRDRPTIKQRPRRCRTMARCNAGDIVGGIGLEGRPSVSAQVRRIGNRQPVRAQLEHETARESRNCWWR